MKKNEIENLLEQAKNYFLKNDRHLLCVEANERSLTHKFGEYLQMLVGSSWSVDCEYNRYGSGSKVIYEIREMVGNETSTDDIKGKTVYPDIIIHQRGGDGSNLLVIEAKKDASSEDRQKDIKKIEKIQSEYKYDFGCFVNFKTVEEDIEWEIFDKTIEFAIQDIKERPESFRDFSVDLRSNKEVVLTAVKWSGDALGYASEELRDDGEVVLGAVKRDGYSLQYASDRLRNNKEVLIEAVKNRPSALMYISQDFWCDCDILRILIDDVDNILELECDLKNMTSGPWNNKKFVLEIVKKYGYFLRAASQDLRNDREVVLTAVKSDICGGRALEYASEELRMDPEIVSAAIHTGGWMSLALNYVDCRFWINKPFIIEVAKLDGWIIKHASKQLRADRDVVYTAVKSYGSALGYASEELQNDRELQALALEIINKTNEKT